MMLGLKLHRNKPWLINASEFFGYSATSEGWHVQWETDPPGKESEPRSLGCIRGGNEADEANRQSRPWDVQRSCRGCPIAFDQHEKERSGELLSSCRRLLAATTQGQQAHEARAQQCHSLPACLRSRGVTSFTGCDRCAGHTVVSPANGRDRVLAVYRSKFDLDPA